MNDTAAAARRRAGSGRASWTDELQQLWHELPGLVNDRIELLSLELQYAGSALVQIVVLIVAAAILGVTAWLVLWAVIVLALMGMGLAVGWALAVALLFNVAAAAWAVLRARGLLPRLRLPGTRRHLMIGKSPSVEVQAAANAVAPLP